MIVYETILWAFFLLLVLLTTLAMLRYPQAAYEGACRGLDTWMTHLLPSLLPFFIAANLLLSLGFVRFLGVLLEPLMRPVFLPSRGSWLCISFGVYLWLSYGRCSDRLFAGTRIFVHRRKQPVWRPLPTTPVPFFC